MEQDYNVWFGKRLKEVMEHKGLTAKGLGEMSGVGRMTISRILQGRYATAEEVKKIADALEITVDRLKQKDVDLQITKRGSRSQDKVEIDLQEARRRVSLAIGKTEIGLALQELGTAFYNMDQYEDALEEYKKSFLYLRDSEDPDLVNAAYYSLMVTYVMIKDYDALEALFEETENKFQHHTLLLARFLHFKASYLAEYVKDYDSAITIYIKSFDLFAQVDRPLDCSRTIGNLGDVCFRMKRYEESKAYYERLFGEYADIETQQYVSLGQYKDYIKTMICLGEMDRARELLEKRWTEAINYGHEKVTGLYLILREILYGDGDAAKKFLAMKVEDEKLNLMTSLLLVFAHFQRGDSVAGIKVLGEMLSESLVLE